MKRKPIVWIKEAVLYVSLAIACFTASQDAVADATPASMFGDHMVLQQGMPVPVWGSAEVGERVTVTFAGHAVTTETDESGSWKVELPMLKASSDGRTLMIEGKNRIVFKDVLVGEVWICSGQSNMQYGWGKESHPMYNWGGVPELADLVADARKKPIRNFNVPTNVSFEPEDNCKGKWSTGISGSAVAFGFGYYLHEALDVPVAVIVTCWGSSSIEGWMPLDMTNQLPHFDKQMTAFNNSEQAQERVRGAMKMGIRHGMVFVRKQPNLLYNAMLHPVIPYACRGMVWYQGEANASRPEEYAASFPLWLKRLRKGWGRDDFHLLAVMLPGYGSDDGRPDAKSWAWFRDAQMTILNLSNTGVANTIDLGDVKNIHPPDKKPICERLALLAQRDIYGAKIAGQGPAFQDSTIKGKRMVIDFDYASGLKTLDDESPRSFWLADKEGSWHQATATIKGSSVILEADGISEPKACRYAFSGKPDVNLVNGDNLPAYPFRTDNWAR